MIRCRVDPGPTRSSPAFRAARSRRARPVDAGYDDRPSESPAARRSFRSARPRPMAALSVAFTPLRPGSTRWQPILPLFLAEFVVWLGFGAFLPILPLYLTSRGIDVATLGLIIAAWPAARLVAEPIFGWIADRTARKPLMVAALLVNAILIPLPLVVLGRARVHRHPGARRAGHRGLRPRSPRVPRRCHPGRPPGRGVRAVRRGADGRAPVRAGDRRHRRVDHRQRGVRLLARGSLASAVASLVVALAVREGRRTRVATGIPVEGVTELPGIPARRSGRGRPGSGGTTD